LVLQLRLALGRRKTGVLKENGGWVWSAELTRNAGKNEPLWAGGFTRVVLFLCNVDGVWFIYATKRNACIHEIYVLTVVLVNCELIKGIYSGLNKG
jgi:hypothetical protein